MLVSTKGRYAIRVLVDMAENNGRNGFLKLSDISERQDISLKYIEKIMTSLTKAKLIESAHGKGGGYRLIKDPEDYTLLEILEITEESLAPVDCLRCGNKTCERASFCRTLPMWKEVYELISGYFGKKTIADLMMQEDYSNWII